jgi:hypothetical protein
MRLRYDVFPLHPLGALLMFTFPVSRMWFSVFLGWALKAAIARYGGASLFRQSRPVFVGLIVGEALAAAVWLCVSLALAAGGHAYKVQYFTP